MKNKMKVFSFLVLIFLVFMSKITFACTCISGGKFVQYSSGHGYSVIRATVKSYGHKLDNKETLYQNMIVEVTDVIKGNYPGQELILGNPISVCHDYVDSSKFEIGSEHYISIRNRKSAQILGNCGESSVLIKGELIEGREPIPGGYKPYTMKTSDLIELLTEDD